MCGLWKQSTALKFGYFVIPTKANDPKVWLIVETGTTTIFPELKLIIFIIYNIATLNAVII